MESVSLGTVTTYAVLDLKQFNQGYAELIGKIGKLEGRFSKIQFNPDGVVFGVGIASDSLKGLGKLAAEVNQNLGKIKFASTGISTGANEGKRSLAGLNETAGQTKTVLAELSRIRLNSSGITGGADAMKADLNGVTQAATKAQAQLTRLNTARVSASSMMQRGTALSAIGNGMRQAGQAATWGYSAPVIGAAGYAVKSAINREDQFADVAKVYPKESAENLATARKELERLSTILPLTFQQLTQLANQGGQLGIPIQALGEYTKVAAELGMVTDLSAEQATMGLAKIAAAMGLNVTNGPAAGKTFHDLGEQLAAMGLTGSATGSEIVRTAERIASAGKNAGMSTGDVLALSNGLASLGQRAEAGGSGALSVITQMSVAVATNNKQLGAFASVSGMSAAQFKEAFQKDALGTLLQFVGGLNQLQQQGHASLAVLSGMGIKSKTELIALQNLSHAIPLVTQYRQANIDAVQKQNALEDASAKKIAATKSQLIILGNEAEGVAAKLGTELLPAVKELVPDVEKFLHTLNGWIDAFHKLPEPVKQGAFELLALSVAAGPVVSILGSVFSVVGSVTRGIAAFKALKTADELKAIMTGASGAEDALGGMSTKLGGIKGLLGSSIVQGTIGWLLTHPPVITAGVLGAEYLVLNKFANDVNSSIDANYHSGGPIHSPETGSSAVVNTMLDKAARGVVEAGLQCGSAITEAFKENGINVTATQLRDRARKKAQYRENPIGVDNRGMPRYHEGTVFFFPKAGRAKEQHFGMAHLSADGQQDVAEYTKAGTGKYHYQNTRPLAVVLNEHGGQMEAFNAVGYGPKTAAKAGGNPNPSGGTPTIPDSAALDDLRRRNYEATHNKFQNERYAAKQTYEKDKAVDPALAKSTYLATLKDIGKREQEEHKRQEAELKRHHAEKERQWQAHLNRLAALLGPNQKVIEAARKMTQAANENRAAMQDSVAAFTQDPETLGLNREEADAQKTFRERMKKAGANTLGPYDPQQKADFALAKQELDTHLQSINTRRADKKKRDADTQNAGADEYIQQAAADTTALNREIWLHAGGDMKAYFRSLRQEADDALQAVKDKYGPLSAHPNAGAVTAAQNAHDTRYKVIGQQETDATSQDADEDARYKLDTGEWDMAKYRDYLKGRAAQIAAAVGTDNKDFRDISETIHQLDMTLWQAHVDDLERAYREGTMNRNDYLKQMEAAKAQMPKTSDPGAGRQVDDAIAQAKKKDTINVHDTLRGNFEETTRGALEHFHGSKGFFKDMVQNTKSQMGSLGASIGSKWLTGQLFGNGLSLTGGFGGFGKLGGLGNLFGGLFGHKKSGAGASGGLRDILGGNLPGLGGKDGTVPVFVTNMPGAMGGGAFGIPGALSQAGNLTGLLGKGGSFSGGPGGLASLFSKGGVPGLSGLLGHGGLAGMFSHGGLMTSGGALGGFGAALPWVGGGLMLNSLLGNPLGKAFKGIKKLFHFSKGVWSVPGNGSGDTVPSMVEPGELIMPRPAAQQFRDFFGGMGRGRGNAFAAGGQGQVTVNVTHHGDINNHEEGERFHEQTAWKTQQAVAVVRKSIH